MRMCSFVYLVFCIAVCYEPSCGLEPIILHSANAKLLWVAVSEKSDAVLQILLILIIAQALWREIVIQTCKFGLSCWSIHWFQALTPKVAVHGC